MCCRNDVGVLRGRRWGRCGLGESTGRACAPITPYPAPTTSFRALSRHSRIGGNLAASIRRHIHGDTLARGYAKVSEGGNPVVRHRANGKGIESLSCSHTRYRPGAGILWISRNTIIGYERMWICGCSE